jgi:hypothetical protein
MFSAKYELLHAFFNAGPLFSSLYELFAQKHRGYRGPSHDANKRCAQKDENII